MHFDLTSGTDLACHAIFDPAAMLDVLNNPAADPTDEDALDEDMERGNVLLHPTGEDGSVVYRVFVGEEPDAASLEEAEPAGEFLLRVPGGTLFACGMEYLFRPEAELIAAEDFAEAAEPLGEGRAIPRGTYRVEAFEVQRPERPRRLADRAITRTGCLGCLVTVFGTVAVGMLTLTQLVFGGEAGRAWRVWPALVGGFWVLFVLAVWVRERCPDHRRYAKERRASRERFPFDVVLVLRRLTRGAGPLGLRGGLIGGERE